MMNKLLSKCCISRFECTQLNSPLPAVSITGVCALLFLFATFAEGRPFPGYKECISAPNGGSWLETIPFDNGDPNQMQWLTPSFTVTTTQTTDGKRISLKSTGSKPAPLNLITFQYRDGNNAEQRFSFYLKSNDECKSVGLDLPFAVGQFQLTSPYKVAAYKA
jgi:hypothetical protein